LLDKNSSLLASYVVWTSKQD